MDSGDRLVVSIHDSTDGLVTSVSDTTTNQTGSMTASVANGFAHPLCQPTASSCTEEPYAFHPMYSTSNEHTSVPWAAHSVGGCLATDFDFDGTSYQPGWSGTLEDVSADHQLHSESFLFTSPLSGGLNYERVAFEADLPAIEFAVGCDTLTGAGCTNPPPGARTSTRSTRRAA